MKKWILWGSIAVVLAVIVFFLYTQTKPTITKSVQVTLNIQAKPDFSLVAVPDTINTYVARTGVPCLAEITADANFSGEVVVSVSGLPAGVTATFLPSDTVTIGAGETRSVQIELAIADDAALIGSHTFTVTATSDTYN